MVRPRGARYLITINPDNCAEVEVVDFYALIQHELLHCAQAREAFGAPHFNRDTGAADPYDARSRLEEFTDIIARHGADVTNVRALFDPGNRKPLFEAEVDRAGLREHLDEGGVSDRPAPRASQQEPPFPGSKQGASCDAPLVV